MKRVTGLGAGVAILAGLAYGASLVAARLSYEHGSNFLTIVSLRYTVLCLLLWLWLRSKKKVIEIRGWSALRSLAVGAVALSTSIAYLASIAYIPVGLATLIFYTHPLLVVLVAAGLYGERSTVLEVGATVFALAGLILVLNVALDSLRPLGIVFGVYASVSAAIVFFLSDRVLVSVDPLRFTLYMSLAAAAIANTVVLAGGAMAVPETGEGLAWLVAAVAVNIVGLLGMFVSVHLIGPVSTPMILNIEPITAIALATVLLGEKMTPLQMAGALVVIVAVFVAQWSRARRM